MHSILEHNKTQKIINELHTLQMVPKFRSEENALDIEYYKRILAGDTEKEAKWYVMYRKTAILWEYRRDILKQEI